MWHVMFGSAVRISIQSGRSLCIAVPSATACRITCLVTSFCSDVWPPLAGPYDPHCHYISAILAPVSCDPGLYWLLTFQVLNLMSIFCHSGHSERSAHVTCNVLTLTISAF